MSWFLIVQLVNRSAIKYIVWGTGAEAPPQLFNLTADPGEFEDLLDERRPPSEEARRVAKLLDSNLRATIDYPVVAQRVAHYNLDSFRAWANHTGPDWPTVMRGAPAGQKGHLRWTPSWDDNPDGSLEAVHEGSRGRRGSCRAARSCLAAPVRLRPFTRLSPPFRCAMAAGWRVWNGPTLNSKVVIRHQGALIEGRYGGRHLCRGRLLRPRTQSGEQRTATTTLPRWAFTRWKHSWSGQTRVARARFPAAAGLVRDRNAGAWLCPQSPCWPRMVS